jgi:thiamine biosynthesis lipoprotein
MSIGKRSWHALGTTVVVLATDPLRIEAAAGAVEEMLAGADAAYSRFRPDSELSRLNARPGVPVRVSALLAAAVAAALRAARLTGGAVDPTVGRAMRRIGYEKDFALVARRAAAIELSVERVPGWWVVQLDRAAGIVRIPAGTELDLGSTGKALAADLAAPAALAAAGAGGVLVSLGGDIATAGEPPPGGWTVIAAEKCSAGSEDDGQVIRIATGALATSGTTVRRWSRGGVELHHIIDPTTGLPADVHWRTATVAAASCVDANAAATAAIVQGRHARSWLDAHRLDARLV